MGTGKWLSIRTTPNKPSFKPSRCHQLEVMTLVATAVTFCRQLGSIHKICHQHLYTSEWSMECDWLVISLCLCEPDGCTEVLYACFCISNCIDFLGIILYCSICCCVFRWWSKFQAVQTWLHNALHIISSRVSSAESKVFPNNGWFSKLFCCARYFTFLVCLNAVLLVQTSPANFTLQHAGTGIDMHPPCRQWWSA